MVWLLYLDLVKCRVLGDILDEWLGLCCMSREELVEFIC